MDVHDGVGVDGDVDGDAEKAHLAESVERGF